MVACVASEAVVASLYREDIYNKKLKRRGLRAILQQGPDPLETCLVKDAMRTEVTSAKARDTAREVSDVLEITNFDSLPVLDERGDLVGLVTHHEVNHAVLHGKGDRPVGDIMLPKSPLAYPDETLRNLLSKAGARDASGFPVVDRQNPRRLIGFITKNDILRKYTEVNEQGG